MRARDAVPTEAGDEGEVDAEGIDEPLEGRRGVVGERFDEAGTGEVARGGFGVAELSETQIHSSDAGLRRSALWERY